MRRDRRRGSAMIEFALCAIPVIFALISIFEICRGMWNYHTLAETVKVAGRTISVRGAGCAGKACAMTVDSVAHLIAATAIGLPDSSLNVTLTSTAGNVNCNPLRSCYGNSAAWPPASADDVGSLVTISASYTFNSAIAMFVPGKGSMTTPALTFAAKSTQGIVF